MSEDPGRETGAERTEEQMREHEREARERSEDERGPDGTSGDDGAPALGTDEEGGVPAPPGNASGNLGGAS